MTQNVTPIQAKGEITDSPKAQVDTAAASATQAKAPAPQADAVASPKSAAESAAQNAVMAKELEALRQRAKTAEDKVHELNRKLNAPTETPLARPAHMKKRHWGVLASFLFMVVAPLAGALFYLFVIAEDQYISSAGFTVRGQEGTSATDLLGGLAQFAGAGGSTGSDSAILY